MVCIAFLPEPVQIDLIIGARHAVKTNMRTDRTYLTAERRNALQALQLAVMEGATARYQGLLDRAIATGATDEEIDLVVYEAVRNLFVNAERPLTGRDLAHLVPAGCADE